MLKTQVFQSFISSTVKRIYTSSVRVKSCGKLEIKYGEAENFKIIIILLKYLTLHVMSMQLLRHTG